MNLHLLKPRAMSCLFWVHCIAACLSEVVTDSIGVAIGSNSYSFTVFVAMVFAAPIVIPLRLLLVLPSPPFSRLVLISCGTYIGFLILGFAMILVMKQRKKHIVTEIEDDNIGLQIDAAARRD